MISEQYWVYGDRLDAIGVYSAAAIPSAAAEGYGAAITRYGVEQAARTNGLHRSIPQSTPAGLGLYKQMRYPTSVLGTTAPVESVTVPVIVPKVD